MVRILGLAAVLVACTDPQTTPGVTHVQVIDIPSYTSSAIDVLVVVDDSPAMANYVDRVTALGPALERASRTADGGPLDLHVAAITSTGNPLRTTSRIDGAFAVDVHAPNGTRTENFDGSFGYALSQLFASGSAGSGASQPFAAIRNVLAAPPPDFLRTSAYLGIVVVTAQDDASPDTPDALASFLKGVHADPANVTVAGIYPAPAPRLDQFFSQFPNRNTHVDLATGDLDHTFDLFGQLLKTTLGAACFDELADVDPATDGLQYDCALSAIREDGVETALVPCDSGLPGGCWKFVPDPVICVAPSVRLTVRGFAETVTPHIRGACVAR